jgi:hypothetical protein
MDDHFLSRWSRRKLASKAGPVGPTADAIPAQAGIQPTPEAGRHPPSAGVVPESPATQLPPVESLTPESDFTPFMKAEVDPSLRRAALKTLFSDPRFNVMDGLDVYIDDYSKPDPLPPEWLGQMRQMKYLGHYIEEVPDKDAEKAGDDAAPAPEAMHEQPGAFPENAQALDTSDGDPLPPESASSIDDRGVSSAGTGAKLPSNEA